MITETFVGSGVVETDSLYQWDLNQVLAISGSGLTVPPVIHFTQRKPTKVTGEEALVVQATISGGVVKANIPNLFLEEPFDIIAFMYAVDSNSGKTLEMIRIPVIQRPKPADYEYSDNITIQTAGALEGDIVAYYNRAISQLNTVNTNLTGAIDAEEAARIAGDADLKAQIDAIVIAAADDGNAAAEVGQARVNANGKAYTSLKARLDETGIYVGDDGGIYQIEDE